MRAFSCLTAACLLAVSAGAQAPENAGPIDEILVTGEFPSGMGKVRARIPFGKPVVVGEPSTLPRAGMEVHPIEARCQATQDPWDSGST